MPILWSNGSPTLRRQRELSSIAMIFIHEAKIAADVLASRPHINGVAKHLHDVIVLKLLYRLPDDVTALKDDIRINPGDVSSPRPNAP